MHGIVLIMILKNRKYFMKGNITYYVTRDNDKLDMIIEAPCEYIAFKKFLRKYKLKEKKYMYETTSLIVAERSCEGGRWQEWKFNIYEKFKINDLRISYHKLNSEYYFLKNSLHVKEIN